MASRKVWLQKPMPNPINSAAGKSHPNGLPRSSAISTPVPAINNNAPISPVVRYELKTMMRLEMIEPQLHDTDRVATAIPA